MVGLKEIETVETSAQSNFDIRTQLTKRGLRLLLQGDEKAAISKELILEIAKEYPHGFITDHVVYKYWKMTKMPVCRKDIVSQLRALSSSGKLMKLSPSQFVLPECCKTEIVHVETEEA